MKIVRSTMPHSARLSGLSRRGLLQVTAGAAASLALPSVFAQAEAKPAAIRLGVATIPKIWAYGKFDGTYERDLGVAAKWVSYDSGAVLLPMFAAGEVDLAVLGSPPIMASIARKLPIRVLGAPEIINTSERLIGRDNIKTVKDLEGKRVAFPGASTLHYALETALRVHGVDGSKVKRLTLSQPEIVAAWRRGDVDAAYIAGPFWSELLAAGGHQVMASGELQPDTYVWNGIIVRNEFAEKYPSTVARCLQTMQRMYGGYKADPSDFSEKLAKAWGASPEATKQSLAGLTYPTFEEQLTPRYFGSGPDTPNSPLVKSMNDTGKFLAELGELPRSSVPPSYAPFVDVALMRRAFPVK
ncbi:MAG: transporter substrate-binding domain-containing protein [Proteobacteria bacterium]|nr:MAG: transporter substrate-binding domain-containing protein [Pseudomonadota bacterium]